MPTRLEKEAHGQPVGESTSQAWALQAKTETARFAPSRSMKAIAALDCLYIISPLIVGVWGSADEISRTAR